MVETNPNMSKNVTINLINYLKTTGLNFKKLHVSVVSRSKGH